MKYRIAEAAVGSGIMSLGIVRPLPLPIFSILITITAWCDPFKTWQKAYSFDPLTSLTGNQTSLVLCGESLLWTEQSGPENMDSIAWPRAASGAEVPPFFFLLK
jgi:hypothetical protein